MCAQHKEFPACHGTIGALDTDGASYLDDVLVSGDTLEVARANLVTVMSRIKTGGFRLHVDKCSILEHSCVYRCHRLDGECIHPTTY